jgi:hypothetical protein
LDQKGVHPSPQPYLGYSIGAAVGRVASIVSNNNQSTAIPWLQYRSSSWESGKNYFPQQPVHSHTLVTVQEQQLGEWQVLLPTRTSPQPSFPSHSPALSKQNVILFCINIINNFLSRIIKKCQRTGRDDF